MQSEEDSSEKTVRPCLLVVADGKPEMAAALRWAAGHAKLTGAHVALVAIVEPIHSPQWMAIDDLARSEALIEAQRRLQQQALEVLELVGSRPIFLLREGDPAEQLFELIDEQQSISGLVLAADPGPKGPGPLIMACMRRLDKLRVPLTIVPGDLSEEGISFLPDHVVGPESTDREE